MRHLLAEHTTKSDYRLTDENITAVTECVPNVPPRMKIFVAGWAAAHVATKAEVRCFQDKNLSSFIMPFCFNKHWILIHIDRKRRVVEYYDSNVYKIICLEAQSFVTEPFKKYPDTFSTKFLHTRASDLPTTSGCG
jgi:hypothetical protein